MFTAKLIYMKDPYLPFEDFVFRTPLLPFNTFIQYLNDITDSENKFKGLLNNKVIQEAIFLASPVLFEELIKYLDKGLPSKKEENRFRYSIVRYFSRMSTRCTPFGLFAGCSVGHFAEKTRVVLKDMQYYKRHTRLDMNYLCALVRELAANQEIRSTLNYYPNPGIYRFGDKFRYVEYLYKGTRRVHQIAAVNYSEYLDTILYAASPGKKIDELAGLITDEEITIEDAREFVSDLIDAQLLVSELEPTVTGPDSFSELINLLQQTEKSINSVENSVHPFLEPLQQIRMMLDGIDKHPIGSTLHYDQIIGKIKETGVSFEPKFLFQTDLFKPVTTATLAHSVTTDILEAIGLLNRITINSSETNLAGFRDAFSERYEEREMPLLQVLDNESGIGYNQSGNAGDINPLVDDLVIPHHTGETLKLSWNAVQSILLKKYIEAKPCKEIVNLADEDFEFLKPNWDDLPLTISVMCRILQEDGTRREIFMKSAGGSCAANLLGRFCYLDKQIEDHVRNIIHKEEGLKPDAIFAEIAHLPESRTGNILSRPVLRAYEIPYMARPGVTKEHRIELSDLMISVRNKKIFLRSKRFNKEVIPRLSTAHNYSHSAMPVYHFLCDMQLQNQRGGVWFNWGTIINEQNWLPRVKYKNIILSPARWTIKSSDIKAFREIKEDNMLADSITSWRQNLKMPQHVVLDDGDNELFVDLNNALSIRILLTAVKKRHMFNLEEFLFNPETAIVKAGKDVFTNEFIISFYKNDQDTTYFHSRR